MNITKHSKKFTDKEEAIVDKNLSAFIYNFSYILLHKYDHGAIEIYASEQGYKDGEYVYRCDNIYELNGWLYGMVQGYYKVTNKFLRQDGDKK